MKIKYRGEMLSARHIARRVLYDKLSAACYWHESDGDAECMEAAEFDEVNRQLNLLIDGIEKRFGIRYDAGRKHDASRTTRD